MFSKFKDHVDTIFVDINSANFELDKSVNIILSPSLYWVKKVSLPVKSVREVKPLLESLFEENLPNGTYSYEVYKQDDDFFIFAYEDQMILNILHEKGVASSQINKVYLAQSELFEQANAKRISEDTVLLVEDGIVVLLPVSFASSDELLDVCDVKLSKNSIRLKQFSHFVNEKSLYTIAIIFFVLIALVSIEYFITLKKDHLSQTQRNELFMKYGLKPTMFQNRSMLRGYESIYKSQTQLRQYMADLLSLKLKKNHKIKMITYKNKQLSVEFIGLKAGEEKYIEQMLKSKKCNFSAQYKNNIWYVEFKI
ncbi:hypothetical protein [Sulfurimonas sp.]